MSWRAPNFPKQFYAFSGWVLLHLIASQASALVLHPTGEPPANWTAKPPNSVVGQWVNTASCVAIAPNYILAVRHPGGGINPIVIFDGVEYIVAEQFSEPTAADLRICRIKQVPPPENPTEDKPANLQYYATPYSLTDEVGQEVVMGGFGDDRGATLLTPNEKPYGYVWDPILGNTVQHWGTNVVDQISGTIEFGGFTSETFLADFDDLNVSGTTPFEAAMAEHDSGGGLFVWCGNSWKVAGIGLGTADRTLESWFRTNNNANQPSADRFLAIRVSAYAAWINSIVPQPSCVNLVDGDFNGNCITDSDDLILLTNQWKRTDCSIANNNCSGADFQPDGTVNLLDFAFLTSGWMTSAELMQPCN